MEAVEEFSWDSLGVGCGKLEMGKGEMGRAFIVGKLENLGVGRKTLVRSLLPLGQQYSNLDADAVKVKVKTTTTCATHSHHMNLLSYPLIIIFFFEFLDFIKFFF